jgi:hypothetical protein
MDAARRLHSDLLNLLAHTNGSINLFTGLFRITLIQGTGPDTPTTRVTANQVHFIFGPVPSPSGRRYDEPDRVLTSHD